MSVLTPIPVAAATPLAATATAPASTAAAGPACSLQRSGSLWQLGIEAQELTAAIAHLAEQLEAEEEETRSRALAELEAALLAEEGNHQALSAKADATCWVIEHLRGQAAYRKQPRRPAPLPPLLAHPLTVTGGCAMGPLQGRARISHPVVIPITPEAMDLSVYATPSATSTPTSPRPKGHIWSTRLSSWVVPITR
jgi:hypothetical protein